MDSKKLIYNPFKKEFWNKKNLISEEKVDNLKVSFQKLKEYKVSETSKKLLVLGESIRKWGSKLTFGLTLPILLTIFLGPLGLGIGILLFIGMIVGMFTKKKTAENNNEKSEKN